MSDMKTLTELIGDHSAGGPAPPIITIGGPPRHGPMTEAFEMLLEEFARATDLEMRSSLQKREAVPC